MARKDPDTRPTKVPNQAFLRERCVEHARFDRRIELHRDGNVRVLWHGGRTLSGPRTQAALTGMLSALPDLARHGGEVVAYHAVSSTRARDRALKPIARYVG